MEQEQPVKLFEFGFDETSQHHLRGISQWMSINAILSFVGLFLDMLLYLKESTELYRRSSLYISAGFKATNGYTLALQIIASVSLNLILLMGSIHIKRGLNALDNDSLTKGMGLLRTYYKIYGIFAIIVMIIAVVGLLY
jgi:hypothetical protein